MYLHGHAYLHDPNVVTFGHNKLWFAVGMCHAQRGGGGRDGGDDGRGQDGSTEKRPPVRGVRFPQLLQSSSSSHNSILPLKQNHLGRLCPVYVVAS